MEFTPNSFKNQTAQWVKSIPNPPFPLFPWIKGDYAKNNYKDEGMLQSFENYFEQMTFPDESNKFQPWGLIFDHFLQQLVQ